ncbi:hypothetical protein D1609_15805 [Leptospira borgpetersenii serovar Hardjo-bovis]|nr:hypothetical protein B9T54_15675 [Leptospira borgpetersenii serovar Hardjo-bovis]AYR09663.1 hypothetical protein D1609_15805 [Leptospira borgpetersenii serovar Hardjo-bovis]
MCVCLKIPDSSRHLICKGGLKISGSLFYLGLLLAKTFRKWNVLFSLGFFFQIIFESRSRLD